MALCNPGWTRSDERAQCRCPWQRQEKNKKNRGFDKARIGGPAVAAATTGG
jgi:hypothetical protein